MDYKVKAKKVKTKCGSKVSKNYRSRKYGTYVACSKPEWNLKTRTTSAIVKHDGKRSVYCQMYEQEERDIDRAIDVIAKFAHEQLS